MCATAGRNLHEAAEKMTVLFQREEGPAEWARTHHSIYEFHKFAAVGLTRKMEPDPNRPHKKRKQPPIQVRLDDNHIIQTTTHHKFLGVIIDKELRFKEQAAYALGKGMKSIGMVGRLTKTTKGMGGTWARRLYYGAIAPSMLYAVEIWASMGLEKGEAGRARGTVGTMKKMESVQRKAAIQATGALRSTPSDLLFAHADMPPLAYHIKQICQNSALRIATLLEEHPLHKIARRSSKICPKRHPSPLHSIFRAAKVVTDDIETIDTLRRHPSWNPPIPFKVEPTKAAALKAERDREVDLKLYSDGSAHDGHVGAAAILLNGFRPMRVARHYLGPITKHTVHEAEGVGQLLALGLLRTETSNIGRTSISMGVDSQSSIRAHANRCPKAGGYITAEIHKFHGTLTEIHGKLDLQINWVPGHKGIYGNDCVDEQAKKAAEGPEQNLNSRVGFLRKAIPDSKSAVRQELRRKNKARYTKNFRTLPRYHRMYKIDPTMPSPLFRKATNRLTKRHASILIQLRTGHIPLKAYLHRIGKADTPTCEKCGEDNETVEHYLMRCKQYQNQRRRLQEEIGGAREVDTDILGRPDLFPALFRYIWRTERFQETHGDLEPADDEE